MIKTGKIKLGNYALSPKFIEKYHPLMAKYAISYDVYYDGDRLILRPDYGDGPDPDVRNDVPKKERMTPSLYTELVYNEENNRLILYIKDKEEVYPEYLDKHLKRISKSSTPIDKFKQSLNILHSMLTLDPSGLERKIIRSKYTKYESMKHKQQVSRIRQKLAKLRDMIKMQ